MSGFYLILNQKCVNLHCDSYYDSQLIVSEDIINLKIGVVKIEFLKFVTV